MSQSFERLLFWILLVLLLLVLGLLFLGPSDLLGDENNTQFGLKTMLYPAVLAWLILAWRRIDRNISNAKPGEEE